MCKMLHIQISISLRTPLRPDITTLAAILAATRMPHSMLQQGIFGNSGTESGTLLLLLST